MPINGVQLHLLFNHLPVVGFIGMVLALGISILLKNPVIQRFVLVATFVTGLSALAPFWTGEPAEEIMEDRPGVSRSLIHDHEELAEKALVLSLMTSAAAAIAFGLQRKKPATLTKSVPVVFALALATAGLMGLAAHAGGRIRHPELDEPAKPGATGDISPGQHAAGDAMS